MEDERRKINFCNIYDLHCKSEFIEIKQDVKDIKRALLGENGDVKNSLIVQQQLNTGHRLWMESWGRMIMGVGTVAIMGFIGTLIWLVSNSHAKP